MDPFKSELRKLQEAWSLMENEYIDHIRGHIPLIKKHVYDFLSFKISERVKAEPRSRQSALDRKLRSKVKIDEIGVYGSAVTGKYRTHPDRPGDIDVFVRLSTPLFFQGQDWWNGSEWSKLQDELALRDIPVDVAIIGKHESHDSDDGYEIIDHGDSGGILREMPAIDNSLMRHVDTNPINRGLASKYIKRDYLQDGFSIGVRKLVDSFVFDIIDDTKKSVIGLVYVVFPKIPGYKMISINNIKINKQYQGKGLGYNVYKYLLRTKGVDGLISDTTLTKDAGKGSYYVWKKLSKEYQIYTPDFDNGEVNWKPVDDIDNADRLAILKKSP